MKEKKLMQPAQEIVQTALMNTNQNKSNARETNFFTFFFFGSLSVLEFSLHSSSVIRSAVRVSCEESKIGLVTTLQGQLRAHD